MILYPPEEKSRVEHLGDLLAGRRRHPHGQAQPLRCLRRQDQAGYHAREADSRVPALPPSGKTALKILHLGTDPIEHPKGLRPRWDIYFIQMAYAVSIRADCTRRKVGAVIVDAEHRLISTGYNGAPAGEPGCLEGACPRGRHYAVYGDDTFGDLICGTCRTSWPCPSHVPAGSSYEDCISLHAEVNAVIYAGRDKCLGNTIYVTDEPCNWCCKVITAAGIAKVVIP